MNNLRGISILLYLCIILLLAACSSNSAQNGSVINSNLINETSAPTAAVTASDQIDISKKYDPPIDVSAWRYTESTYQFAEGETIEDNVFTKAYLEELGINLTYDWVTPIDQFEQKMNVTIASGDLPDLMWLNNKQLVDLTENDMLYDLSELYEKYATDHTKEILQQDMLAFNTAVIGEKLMAIPFTSSTIDRMPLLYIKTDWLEALNLDAPKSMDDLVEIMKAFTKDDPDKNGKDDTFGFVFTKAFLTDSQLNTSGFFAGYHSYPTMWIKHQDGGLAYGSVQPETREALLQLQGLYEERVIDLEFGVKDRAKVTETVAAGKAGVFYGTMSAPLSITQPNKLNDANADWQAYELVSVDELRAVPMGKLAISRYHAVSKDAKNPEAIIKLLNDALTGYGKKQDEDSDKQESDTNHLVKWIDAEPTNKNLDGHLNIIKALESNDSSILNDEELKNYNRIVDYRSGNLEHWGRERVFGTPSSFDIINKRVQEGNYTIDQYYGSPTSTMVEKGATLLRLEEEVFTSIIMGGDISQFDKFVVDWNNLGGSDITAEINEWYAKQ